MVRYSPPKSSFHVLLENYAFLGKNVEIKIVVEKISYKIIYLKVSLVPTVGKLTINYENCLTVYND